VALFGGVFASGLNANLAHFLPSGARLPMVGAPLALAAAAPAVRSAYRISVALALHPVFRIATGFAAFAFALSFTLKEIPLRMSVNGEGTKEDADT
jgi:hypothetical protein